jgi:hypothetical protein
MVDLRWLTRFWHKPESWPADPSGYVFLARAVQQIGAAMHGEDWTGQEVVTVLIDPLPARDQAGTRDEVRAFDLLRRHNADFLARHEQTRIAWETRENKSGDDRLPDTRMTNEDWNAARAAARSENDARRHAMTRLDAVQREIVKRCEAKQLEVAVRSIIGGAMKPLSSALWNTESWHPRFQCCQINVESPFAPQPFGGDYSWIFVTAASLEQVLLTQPFEAVSSRDLPHLSPYMRVLLAVAKKLAISPDNQPKKDAVKAELEAAWTGERLSDNLLDAMGTILREPDSQLGRGSRQRARSSKG